ncbi:heat shock transcription factor, Y-linked-like isoform X2 [Accipiter gentilis]|uniref:heat shock transcription factor, Y-linked-like isoform X2 n=1 Tax=Astur gentilis TaxID=8957 RepID=UPI00210F9273|nr:heat shock transcription factor, Y-linked-like isoform X2 [Accipiter gentilis]XP_049682090.1 heat shock transcription factor, Y-linked-like isoform X2 [Accipiter gentilis]
MAGEGNFSPTGTREMKRELPDAETPSISALDEMDQLPDMTSPGPPGQGEREPRDAAGRAIKEERDVQSGGDGHEAERVSPVSTKGAGKANQFSSLSFPEKLWKMLESDEFRSIWWSQGGKYVAINEKLFEEEVLGRERPLRVFATQKMKSFLRQLNSYGFTKVRRHFERSAYLPEFLAEEDAAAAHSQMSCCTKSQTFLWHLLYANIYSTTTTPPLTESIPTCWKSARGELSSNGEPRMHQRWMKGTPPEAQTVSLQGTRRHLHP